MSVDFPASYPFSTPQASKPADVQTLQETFAALLRGFGTEKGSMQTSTLLEVICPADSAKENIQRQQRRENQQHVEQNDFSQIDRKLQNKSEVRNGEIDTGYRNRVDRNETLQHDYQERIERSAILPSARQPGSPLPATTSPQDVTLPNVSPLTGSSSLPNTANITATGSASGTPAAATPIIPAGGGQSIVIMPANVMNPVPVPTQTSPQNVPLQTLTIFTPTGRWGTSRDERDEKEEEKEERDEMKTEKKMQPFAAFEAMRIETTRLIQRKPFQQPKEPTGQSEVQQIAGKPQEKPKEVEADRNIPALEEFLNTSPQNTVVPKKDESKRPDTQRYLNRIAAACEAAAPFAPIRIKINLDHLGTMTLRFYYKADKMSLRFETPSEESAQFLREHLDGLKAILSERKVKIVDIEWYVGIPKPD